MIAWYNEPDPYKAAVLREAIKGGAIAPGDVDERSIVDVRASELTGYTQCHFFAGGGFWSYALRQAGWPDDRPVDTGSCPCPSFSEAGKGSGFDDDRHLWPVWNSIIGERKPPVLFGEQSAAAIGFGWLDLVSGNLEAQGYAVAAAVLGAHSVGAPHRRQRLYFCADTGDGDGRRGVCGEEAGTRPDGERRRRSAGGGSAGKCSNPDGRQSGNGDLQRGGELGLFTQNRGAGLDHYPIGDRWRARRLDDGCDERAVSRADGTPGNGSDPSGGRLGESGSTLGSSGRAMQPDAALGGTDSKYTRLQECECECGVPGGAGGTTEGPEPERGCAVVNSGHADLPGAPRSGPDGGAIEAERRLRAGSEHPGFALRPWRGPGWLDPVNTQSAAITGATRGFWANCDWWYGTDAGYRPIKPGIFPLASRYPGRVGLLRLAGDSIVVPQAVAFIRAYLEAKEGR